jgi:pimeloyl-ACP methyl ester carboxylesterase
VSTTNLGSEHIVLVHGAWQGSWAFDAWVPLLQARGWRTHAVELPGNGWPPGQNDVARADLDSYTDHVAALLDRIGAPVVLVGHSGGGITVSQVAEAVPHRVACLVYLAGMMLPSGMSYGELLALCEAEHPGERFDGIAPHLVWNADRSATRVREAGALAHFLHDCDPAAARHAAGMLREQQESGRAMRNHLSAARFGRVPRIYVECADDRSVMLPLQRKMQSLSPGARRIEMTCGHVPQLAQPALLTERLCAELAAIGAGPLPHSRIGDADSGR